MAIIEEKTVFLDFDGVIKDSVGGKSDAFEKLFLPFGREISMKVRLHHENNGGISRFDKLPLYLKWAGLEPSQTLIKEYAENFSILVKQTVIDSEWVKGVLIYLQKNFKKQQFFLVTATPQEEIEAILNALKITEYFSEVIGSPTPKNEAIKILLDRYNIESGQAVMIGDSNSDYMAATENQVKFVLRKTKLNKVLQQQLDCLMIDNFI